MADTKHGQDDALQQHPTKPDAMEVDPAKTQLLSDNEMSLAGETQLISPQDAPEAIGVAPAPAQPDNPEATILATKLPNLDDPDATVFASEIPELEPETDGLELTDDVPLPLVSDYDAGDDSTTTTTFQGPDFRVTTLSQSDLGERKVRGRREHKKKRGTHLAVVGFVLVALAMVAAIAGAGYYLEFWGGKTVPAMIGLDQSAAEQRLVAKGLSMSVETTLTDNGSGRVLAVSPATGTRVEEGSTVVVTVGADRRIPTVVGTHVDEARAALEAQGASNIRLEYENTGQEGTVLSVSPSEGSIFLSSDPITLVVSMPPKVPDLVGRTEKEALSLVDRAGLTAEVSYVATGSQSLGKVVSTDPAASDRTGQDGIVRLVIVSPQPSEPYDVRTYFDATSRAVYRYLKDKGFSLETGSIDDEGQLQESFLGIDGTIVGFSPTPWRRPLDQNQSEAEDHLVTDATIEGVRVELATGSVPQSGANSTTAAAIEEMCGLTGALSHTSDQSITLPEGTVGVGLSFYCEYGETAGVGWTVFIYVDAFGKTQAYVACAPKEIYASADISQTGGKIADFTAWSEVYDAPTKGVQAASVVLQQEESAEEQSSGEKNQEEEK